MRTWEVEEHKGYTPLILLDGVPVAWVEPEADASSNLAQFIVDACNAAEQRDNLRELQKELASLTFAQQVQFHADRLLANVEPDSVS